MFEEDTFTASSEGAGLEQRLSLHSQQIERVFSDYHLPAQVSGGTVNSEKVTFHLREQFEAGLDLLRDLTREIKQVLGSGDLRLARWGSGLQLSLSRQDEVPVTLVELLQVVTDIPPATALLGVSDDGRPVLLDLSCRDLPHVLLAGEADAGKTSLLRTMAVSLALTNKQSEVQLIVISSAPKVAGSSYTILEPLSYLPHMLAPVTYHSEEAREILAFLAGEVAYREEQGVTEPALVVMIDGFVELVEQTGNSLSDLISGLLQQGADVGLHLVLSTEWLEADALSEHLKANLPVRIVGKMTNERAANIAAGITGAQAEYLTGRGEFAATIDGGSITYFQAAFVGNHDLHHFLKVLQRTRPKTLLAQPLGREASPSFDFVSAADGANDKREFVFDGDSIAWRKDEDESGERNGPDASALEVPIDEEYES